MKLNFQNDTILIFNKNIRLITTHSGHYAIPITRVKQLINNPDREPNMIITLILLDSKGNHSITLKLQRQFAHPSKEKVLQVVKKAGEPWCNNQNLMVEINVLNNCTTCKRYEKTPPKPIVGLPMATRFQCHPDLAVSWYINATNSLRSVHGFSPYELAIGKSRKLPSFLNEKEPALTCKPVSKMFSNNLDAINRPRKVCIISEKSERIRLALSQNIRRSDDIKYIAGDSVYSKCMDSKE